MLALTVIISAALSLASLAAAQTTAAPPVADGKYGVLRTLVSQSCLQQCYIGTCSDIDPACVCSTLANDETAAKACAEKNCPTTAFDALREECVSRSADLGVVFAGEGDGSVATTSSAAAASTAADTTLVPSGGAATELLPPSAAGASAAAVDSTSTSTSTTAATHFSVPARPPGLIAAAVISPIAFLGLLGLGVFLFRRRRQKQLKRASINTFMDQSGPHSPQIGGPLDVRHEKLPDFLNDILRQPENGSRGQRIPAYENPETLGPPTAGMGMGIVQPMGYERRVPTSPQHTTNHTRDPSVGYRSATPAGISGYENPETLGPPTVTRSGSTAAAAGYERRIAASLAPGSTAANRSPTTAGIPAYENPALAYPGYPSAGTGTGTDDPFRDPITTQQTFSFPPPPSSSGGGGSGRGTPAPAPRSGHATPAPAPTLTRNSSLSAISERSRGSAARHGHDTQVEMRIAYRALRREVGDNGSDWGGSQQHSQHHQHSQQQMHNQQLMHQQVVPRRLM